MPNYRENLRKSPPNTIIFPPNGSSQEHRSLNVRYIHSAASLCTIGALSQTNRLAFCINLASTLCLGILQADISLKGLGTFNLE